MFSRTGPLESECRTPLGTLIFNRKIEIRRTSGPEACEILSLSKALPIRGPQAKDMHYFRSTCPLLVLSLSSPRPCSVPSVALFRATTKNTVLRRDWRSVRGLFRQNGPGATAGCTFSKSLFFIVLIEISLSVVFCGPPGVFGPLRAPSGGLRGPNRQTKDTTTLRPDFCRVLRLRAVGQWSTRPQITTEICAECLRRDRCGRHTS